MKNIHNKIAENILQKYKLITYENELYYWNGRYWENTKEHLSNWIQTEAPKSYRSNLVRETEHTLKTTTQKHENELTFLPLHLIPFQNGYYNINTGQLEPHDLKYFYTTIHPIEYNPQASCPKINAFLEDIFENAPEKKQKILELIAYSYYRDLPIHSFFILYGTFRNGKDTIGKIIEKAIGKTNKVEIPLQKIAQDSFIGIKLKDAFINYSTESDTERALNSDVLKALTGQSRMTIRHIISEDIVQFLSYTKLVFCVNSLPKFRSLDNALIERMQLIEFTKSYIGEHQNQNLAEQLTTNEEIQGLITQVLPYLKPLLEKKHFGNSYEPVEEKFNRYNEVVNHIGLFVEQCFYPDPNGEIENDYMYQIYLEYCADKKIRHRIQKHLL